MDLREATPPKGTRQPKAITPEMKEEKLSADAANKEQAPAQEQSQAQLKPIVEKEEDYGDPKIADGIATIKAEGLTKEDIFVVLDTLITTGNVAWDFNLFDKIPCRFQVRPTWITNYIMEVLGKKTNENASMTVTTYNNLLAEYNLAASLAKFKEDSFHYSTAEEFDEIYTHLMQMPYIILSELSKKLVVFDTIITVATSDWAVKNFTKPQQGN